MATDNFRVVKHEQVCRTLRSSHVFPGVSQRGRCVLPRTGVDAVYCRALVWTLQRSLKFQPQHGNNGWWSRSQPLTTPTVSPYHYIYFYIHQCKIWCLDLFSFFAVLMFGISVLKVKTKYISNFPLLFTNYTFVHFGHLGKTLKFY